MKLYIVRHGETNENKATKLMGRSPGKLSATGKTQALVTGETLLNKNINIIYSSPLSRCLDTANLINQFLKKEIVKDDLLLERDFAQLTNSVHKNIDFNALDTPSEENTRLGVESLASVQERTIKFIEKIKDAHRNKIVLVVGHNNPIRMMFAVLLNSTYHEILSKYKIHNCGISVFDIVQGDTTTTETIDDISHLI